MSAQEASFHLFSHLPPELRLKIWTLAHSPRIIPIQCGSNPSSLISMAKHSPSSSIFVSPGCTSSAPLPPTLHTNSESRRESLRFYRPSFGFARTPGRILFRHDTDILFFPPQEGYMASHAQFSTCMSLCDPADLARVRRLAVSESCFMGGAMLVDILLQAAQRFPALLELLLVAREDDACLREGIERGLVDAVELVSRSWPGWRPSWRVTSMEALCPG